MSLQYQDSLVTALYSQLLEEALANEFLMACPGSNGSIKKEQRKDSFFWYWVGRDHTGKTKRIYIGPDNADTGNLVEKLCERKEEAVVAKESIRKTVQAYLVAGGQANEPAHFNIMAMLADHHLFDKGITIVGSHAFVSLCNGLGIKSSGEFCTTTDLDFARPQGISLAIPDDRSLKTDIPSAIKVFDKHFFPVPELDRKQPSTSFSNNRTKVIIDFLTVDRDGNKPVFFEDINVAATPLKFMDYLLGGNPFKGLIIGKYAIPVNLPDPVRFAIHKLIISQERPMHLRTKSAKDVRQAAHLLNYFKGEGLDDDIIDGLAVCRNISGAHKNIVKSFGLLKKHDDEITDWLESLLNKAVAQESVQETTSLANSGLILGMT